MGISFVYELTGFSRDYGFEQSNHLIKLLVDNCYLFTLFKDYDVFLRTI
jgi:hypothetical protein